jgi:hypothetical protein
MMFIALNPKNTFLGGTYQLLSVTITSLKLIQASTNVSDIHVLPFLYPNSCIVIFNLFIHAVFTEQYIESMGQSQQTQLYCGRMAYVY